MFSRGYMDQVLFSPWFSWFLGFDSKTVIIGIFILYSRDFSLQPPFAEVLSSVLLLLMASRFHPFGVVFARFFFHQFSNVDSKHGAKECSV